MSCHVLGYSKLFPEQSVVAISFVLNSLEILSDLGNNLSPSAISFDSLSSLSASLSELAIGGAARSFFPSLSLADSLLSSTFLLSGVLF